MHDGNRRLLRAVLEDRSEISAYVGRWIGGEQVPKNYWLSTAFLMKLVKELEWQVLGGNGKVYTRGVRLIEDLVANSESGRYELFDRVLVGKNDFRQRLREDLEKRLAR